MYIEGLRENAVRSVNQPIEQKSESALEQDAVSSAVCRPFLTLPQSGGGHPVYLPSPAGLAGVPGPRGG